jgi:hypothetical protein
MNEVFPGTAKRFVCNVTGVDGQPQSIPLTFEIRSQDGRVVISGNVVADTDPLTGAPSLGSNYADVLIPLNAPPGVWSIHWQAENGGIVGLNRNDYERIVVRHPPR